MRRRKKKNNFARKLLVFLMALSMVFGLTQIVSAGTYESGRKGSITLTLKEMVSEEETNLLSGVELKLYKVGSVVSNGYVTFETDPALKSTGVDLGNLTTADAAVKAAQILAEAVVSTSLPFIRSVTDAKGMAVFDNLEQGMYLVVQGNPDSNVEAAPMLLSIPYTEDGANWIYDVNAFPKTSVHDSKGIINVTKKIYKIDEEMNIVPLIAADSTFCVGLFLDSEGTIPAGDDYIREICIQGDSSGTASYTNLEEGNYYLFELNEDGTKVPVGQMITIDDETKLLCTITNGNGENSNKAEIIAGQNTERSFVVNNNYYAFPSGYYMEGKIKITKNVFVNGNQTTVGDTFYAGVFMEVENGLEELVEVVELKQNGTVEVSVPLNVVDETVVDTEFKVLETDSQGNPVDKETFGYKVSGEGMLVLNETENTGALTITNEKTTSATPTNPPSQSGGSGGDRNHYSGGSSRPVKTGDDTPIALYVVLLIAAAVIAAGGAVIVRRKKKNDR